MIFSPLESSFLGRTKDGAFVHLKPQPRVTTRRMTIVTPHMSCCCDSTSDRYRPRNFWVLPGHDLSVRALIVDFDFERVELRCDPKAPQ